MSTISFTADAVADDVLWLDAQEQSAWRGFLDVHARFRARLHHELQATSGLSLSDYDVLVRLTDVPDGRLRAFELGDRLQWEKSRVSKHVARMARRGLIVRQDWPEDRHGAYVTLTAPGWRAIQGPRPPTWRRSVGSCSRRCRQRRFAHSPRSPRRCFAVSTT